MTIEGIWRFLSVSRNRSTVAWLGGGLVVVAGGLWSVFTHFEAETADPRSGVSAEQGSIAVGGDITGSTITIEGDLPGESRDTRRDGDAELRDELAAE